MASERLQKILAHAGVASRRHAEQLILTGRVKVNGRVVTELGTKADPDVDHIKVDNKRVSGAERHVYLAMHKPRGVVTTASDPEGRQTVLDLLKGVKERVYPVGRLDYASEGLLLLTNDGAFANRITSAKNEVPKIYLAKVTGRLTLEQEDEFRAGIMLEGRRTAPAGLRHVRQSDAPWYEIRLIEGRQNQIRMMFKHFGRMVEKLKRVKIGFLELGPLKPGDFRRLTPAEVERFQKLHEQQRNIGTTQKKPDNRGGGSVEQPHPPGVRRVRVHAARGLSDHPRKPEGGRGPGRKGV
jgi:23S rRNA pseudouridine2605 synthase